MTKAKQKWLDDLEARDARRGPALDARGRRRGARGGASGEGDAVVPECTACGTCASRPCRSTSGSSAATTIAWTIARGRSRASSKPLLHAHRGRPLRRARAGRGARPLPRARSTSARPDCCRALGRGSGQCLGELNEKRERPLLGARGAPSPRGRRGRRGRRRRCGPRGRRERRGRRGGRPRREAGEAAAALAARTARGQPAAP